MSVKERTRAVRLRERINLRRFNLGLLASLRLHWPGAGLAGACERLECLCQGTLSFEISGCLRR